MSALTWSLIPFPCIRDAGSSELVDKRPLRKTPSYAVITVRLLDVLGKSLILSWLHSHWLGSSHRNPSHKTPLTDHLSLTFNSTDNEVPLWARCLYRALLQNLQGQRFPIDGPWAARYWATDSVQNSRSNIKIYKVHTYVNKSTVKINISRLI